MLGRHPSRARRRNPEIEIAQAIHQRLAKNANAVMDIVQSLFTEEGESYERGNQNRLAISSRSAGIVPGI